MLYSRGCWCTKKGSNTPATGIEEKDNQQMQWYSNDVFLLANLDVSIALVTSTKSPRNVFNLFRTSSENKFCIKHKWNLHMLFNKIILELILSFKLSQFGILVACFILPVLSPASLIYQPTLLTWSHSRVSLPINLVYILQPQRHTIRHSPVSPHGLICCCQPCLPDPL